MSDLTSAAAPAPVAASAPARRRRKYIPPDELLPLFRAVARYRGLTVPHAHHLVLAGLDGGRAMRTTRERVQTLVTHGFLDVLTLPARPPVRFLHLTRSSFSRFPVLETLVTDNARKPPPPDLAVHAWHRAALAVSARAAGFEVGRDLAALTALRRSLVDRQQARVQAAPENRRAELEQVLSALRRLPLLTPWTTSVCEGCGLELAINDDAPRFCPECGSSFRRHVVATPHECSRCGLLAERGGVHVVAGKACPGVLRHVDHLPFDVAWKKTASGYEVQVLLADNPFRAIQSQLDELPLRIVGQPKLEVVVRPSDDGSVFDRARSSYAVRGPRYRAILRAFSEKNAKADSFPFWTTATVASDALYPEANFRAVTHETAEQHT